MQTVLIFPSLAVHRKYGSSKICTVQDMSLYNAGRLMPVARYNACQIVCNTWEQRVLRASGVVLVSYIMPAFPAGTYRHYRGSTTIVPTA